MKRKNGLIVVLVVLLSFALQVRADRKWIPINDNWKFRLSSNVNKNSTVRVDLPHTWNTMDALSGNPQYYRGIGNYTKELVVPESWKGRRLFIRFQGANTVADVFLNGKHIGEHRGGYEAFLFELTELVEYGKKNVIGVRVNNSPTLDVMPLVGDFNFYGGLYRGVDLLLTDQLCISPLDYASPGVYLRQKKVTRQQATIMADVLVSNPMNDDQKVTVSVAVKDGDRTLLTQQREAKVSQNRVGQMFHIPLTVSQPHLWNGTKDPFLYQVVVTLSKKGKVLDQVVQPLGLRFYHVDPEKGFFLNGEHLALHGVCRHQERAQIGNALHLADHEEDVRLMRTMGVNAIRLSHYPQADDFIHLLDQAGIVAWSEIPFVGPGGYADKGFVDSKGFRENGKQQLKEMIRQLYNHPSICFWGLFNELKEEGDNPVEYIRELNALAHQEDETRLTTCASNQGGDMNFITDVNAWNRYDGWYGSTPRTLATYLDAMHAKYPQLKIAISEYGAGASIYQQQDSLKQPSPGGWWHPENWQTYYHIKNWEILSSRPFVWGSFVWNMFDFGAAHRTEGDRPGINDKGLVTHDRKTCKDAYYFYKANWNPEPMVYIAGKRCTTSHRQKISLWVFSNCGEVTLNVNGKTQTQRPDRVDVCTFDVELQEGTNQITATAGKCSDRYTVVFQQTD